VSRAAKGADCKSAGLRLRRFESYLPHHLEIIRQSAFLAAAKAAIFVCRMLHDFPQRFQWLSSVLGGYTRHTRDTRASGLVIRWAHFESDEPKYRCQHPKAVPRRNLASRPFPHLATIDHRTTTWNSSTFARTVVPFRDHSLNSMT
jgi:hypothetical protein